MVLRDVFGRNLRQQRLLKGLSQEGLAADAGIDRTYVSALERGVYSASIDMIEKLAAVLEIPPHALLVANVKSSAPKGR
jgi:transcriptional regulator with XRE-family HTH domain